MAQNSPAFQQTYELPPAAWHALGRCREVDPELFFPERGESPARAKRVCGGCKVRAECLAWAMDTGERFGVWGGATESERRQLRAAARSAAAAADSGPVAA